MPGNSRSQHHTVAPVTLAGMPGIGKDLPTTLYSDIGLTGGLPVTVSPSIPPHSNPVTPLLPAGANRTGSPFSGIVNESWRPRTISPYVTLWFTPEMTPSAARSLTG